MKYKGKKLWNKAQKIIPGGTMLFSKKPDLHLPGKWPNYFSKSKGVNIWDLDGNKYIDMMFHVGTNLLGYANKTLDNYVKKIISNGTMTTLNCPEEVFLAQKLLDLHPWAKMVKFARSGGESNAIAIRIARASTNKQNIAICGYHGWHDWYLAANLNNSKKLSDHLMNDLQTDGVSKKLAGTVFPFIYNDYEYLEKLIEKKNIGIIKMEVSRNLSPQNNFLKKVRKLATKKNIVLIFDECTSGFRETFGGIHKKFSVFPDMAMFGKALGNGYAISAVIGRKEIMENCKNTFISSTFWTERIGSSAGLKTLEIMEKLKSWDIISKNGKYLKKRWHEISISTGVKIEISGIDSICSFNFLSPNTLAYRTYLTQTMMQKGYLASNLMFVSVLHNKSIIDRYLVELEKVFKKIKNFEDQKDNVDLYLKGNIIETTFKRLN